MLLMQWDFELEQLAALLVAQCVYTNGGVDTSNTGQSIGALSNTSAQPSDIMITWYDQQKSNFNFQNPDFSKVGELTQIIWSNTNRVGCSMAVCPTLTGWNGTGAAAFYVCNYEVVGNTDPSVYQSGTPCTACPSTHPQCANNLCSPDLADGGQLGAEVFPVGDQPSNNETKKKRLSELEEVWSEGTQKRFIPSGGIDPGGECQDGRFNMWITVHQGLFSTTDNLLVAVVVTIATQIYYTEAVYVPANTVGNFSSEIPHLFTCLQDSGILEVYVYNCLSFNTTCGGGFGIPPGLQSEYSFPLDTWDSFDETQNVVLSAGGGDPRQLTLQFNYGTSLSNNKGKIIAGCLSTLIVLAIIVGGYYWYRKRKAARVNRV